MLNVSSIAGMNHDFFKATLARFAWEGSRSLDQLVGRFGSEPARALLAGLTDRPNGAAGIDWCDDLVAGPGRVERRSDVGYLGLGRAEPDVTGCGAARRR